MGNRRQSPPTRTLRTSLLAALGLFALVGHGADEGPQVVDEGHARRGSSLAGSVIEDDGRPVPDCVVEAQAHEPGVLPDDPPPRTFAVRTDARGAFELTGLAAGEYWIRATASGRSSLPEVRALRSGKRELLTAPLVVRPPQPLELRLDPPRNPLGQPWLLSLRGRLDRANPPAQDTPVADGRWTHPGLVLDTYEVRVGDLHGNTWRTVAANVGGPTTLDLDLGSVPVAGQVSLGGQPLAARLVFAAGGERLTLDTDAHGRYRGFLPDWNWRGSSSRWSVTVRARHVARRLLARLDWPPGGRAAPYSLDLPATTLRGVVTNEAGAPAARDAWLVLPDEGPWARFGEPPEPPLTLPLEPPAPDGAPGAFLVRGLPQGPLRLVAEGQHSRSQEVVCHVPAEGEGRATPLVLRPVVRVSVRLLGSHGLLGWARVAATPIGGAAASPQEQAAAHGTLELVLPGDTTGLALAVARRGRLFFARLAVHDRARIALRAPETTARLRLGQGLAGRPGRLFLVHGTQAVAVEALRRLGATRTEGAAGTLLVEAPPGSYALCAFTEDEARGVPQGASRPAGCAEGVAVEEAELRLSLHPGRE